jgi:hypothetical protein
MDKEKKIKYTTLGLSVLIAIIFLSSLPYKFTNAAETQYIFTTVGNWLGLSLFVSLGGYVIGTLELIASILLFVRGFKFSGAALAFVIMTGAIFFHLFSPLGINVNGDGGALFISAVLAWVSSIALMYIHKKKN